MSFLITAVLFLFGLGLGSFLNVVILRYRPEAGVFNLKNLSGRSHCPHCGKKLAWFELVPVFSFLIQGGRCRTCHHRLSWQYPVVEVLSGLIFAVFFSPISPIGPISPISPIWILIFLTWLLISFIDLRLMLIPNELNLILAGLGVLLILIGPISPSGLIGSQSFLKEYAFLFSPFPDSFVLNHLLGAAAGAAVFGFIYWVGRKRAMGFGDVKLAAASGLVLGWPDIGLAIILSFILGGFVGSFAILSGQKTMKDRVPFGPILILGSVLTVFFGQPILRGYFQLFGF